MHKVHATVIFQHNLAKVFAAISDHRSFLSGGGLTCRVIQAGKVDKNGLGAIRSVRTQKYTFIEEITAYVENESYDYIIKEVKPRLAFKHHNGWIDFKQVGHKQVQVDWHSHFTFTTPVIGHFIGWVVKRKVKKVFLQRLNLVNKKLQNS